MHYIIELRIYILRPNSILCRLHKREYRSVGVQTMAFVFSYV